MINSLTILLIAVLAVLSLVVPRRYFLVPYIIAACFVPTDQRIIIMGLDFTALRILVLSGMFRMLGRNENTNICWNRFDKIVLMWALCGAMIYVLQWSNMKAIVNRCGFLFDVMGLYWLFRQSIRSWKDVEFVIRFLALSSVVLAPLIAMEWLTGQNPFAVLGRVITSVREGRYRCQGAFPHSIMLGLFWATVVPIFIGLSRNGRNRHLYRLATGAAIFIVCGSASSTPLVVLMEMLFLVVLFRYRSYGKHIFYAFCGLVVCLHMVMNNPVWHLIARVDMVGGSTGYHRFRLIDEAVKHFDEWALLGTRDTAHWGRGLGDVTNQYVLEAVRGGLATLVLFVLLFVVAIRTIGGYSLRRVPASQQWLAWCLCVSVLGHCLAFIGVSYFGQIMMLLYLTLAMVGLIYEISNLSTDRVFRPAMNISV